MFRISILLIFMSILCLYVQPVYGQGSSDVKGVHIEWYGYGDPPVNVNYNDRIVTITLSRDGDTVSVYSPATDIDYTFIIRTPNGQVVAERPHPDGFEGTFSFSQVKNDHIVKAQIVHGKAYFESVTGERRDFKSEQIVDILIPKEGSASIQKAEEGFKHKTPKTQDSPVIPKKEVVIPPQPDGGDDTLDLNGGNRNEPNNNTTNPPLAKEETVVENRTDEEIPKVAENNKVRKSVKFPNQFEPQEKPLYVYKNEDAPLTSRPVGYVDLVDYPTASWAVLWGGYRRVELDGTIAFDLGVIDGTNIELEDLLDEEEEDDAFRGGLDFYVGGFHIGADYSYSNFDETGALANNSLVGGQLLVAGTATDTEFEFEWIRGTVGYTVYLRKYFGIGFDAWLEYVRIDFDIDFIGTGVVQKNRYEEFIPGAGMHFNFIPTGFWMMTVGGYAGYMHDNEELWKWSAYASTRIALNESLFLFGRFEYEMDDFDIQEDDDNFNVDIKSFGASVGLGFRF